MPNTLQELLDAQSALQNSMPSKHPTDLFWQSIASTDTDKSEAIDFITWNVVALEDELHELLGETGWKPWAKSKHINLEAARGEAIDALHFLLNLFLVLGMDAEDITTRYHAKREKNKKRQEDDYDGVSTKCPRCKRALDDDAVACTPTFETQQGDFYCALYKETFAL